MSILLWLLLFGIGFLIFKHCQRKKRERALIEQQNQAYRNMNYIPLDKMSSSSNPTPINGRIISSLKSITTNSLPILPIRNQKEDKTIKLTHMEHRDNVLMILINNNSNQSMPKLSFPSYIACRSFLSRTYLVGYSGRSRVLKLG